MTVKIVTANRLTDGVAVWLGSDGRWEDDVTHALIATDAVGYAVLEDDATRAVQAALVVDAVLIDATQVDGYPVPTKLKERIRALGPTVRLDLGKQADKRLLPERAA